MSAGIYQGTALLDLDYLEDKDAEVDANIVMTGSGNYVEVQSSGEEATYSEAQLNELIRLGKEGIAALSQVQRDAIESARSTGND